MHRAIPAAVVAALLVAACGDDEPAADDQPATESESADTGADQPASESESESESADSGADPGSDQDGDRSDGAADDPPDDGGDGGDDGDGATGSDEGGPDSAKPAVAIPESVPEELIVTTLVDGDGPEAEDGDTLLVDYVGVRSVDGTEFDNSYDRGQPLAVTLGTGGVIEGWDQGLVGARAGERRQLDIPSDLAYGDEARSDVIRANEALTFVIDVRCIIQPGAAEPPTGDLSELGVDTPTDAAGVTTIDLEAGEGDELAMGDIAVFHFVLFRGDNGVALDSTWSTEPIQLPLEEGNFPGLLDGLPGMQVGGRRAITVPPEDGFGAEGNPQLGLPADTDIVLVVDLLGRC